MMLRLLLTFGLFFSVSIASAQMLDEAEREQKYQGQVKQLLQVSEWLQDMGYAQSSLMLALTGLNTLKQPPAENVLKALSSSIDSAQLDKADWHQLTRFCRQAQRYTKFNAVDNIWKINADKYNSWCEDNHIQKKYIKLDSDNAYVYLFQINFSAADPYNSENLSLLRKAALAKYATDYFGFGMQAYTSHLREYYRTHQTTRLELPAGTVFDSEDAFILPFTYSAVATHVAFPNSILGFCDKSQRQGHAGFNEKTVADCIRLMKLFRSDKNTLSDVVTANAIISGLSQPGSEQQLEAERQRITNHMTIKCLSAWGDTYGSEAVEVTQLAVFFKMQPLLESMGEIQALAVASDQYFAAYQNKDEPKPSSCLLLKDLGLEAARKMQAGSDKV